MRVLRTSIATGTIWTIAAYAVTQGLRFGTNVVLARLLAPEIFGIFAIVNTLRTGAELLSDIGTTQSIVQSKHADDPAFYGTAWTMQLIRGILVFALFAFMAHAVAKYFEIPDLTAILVASGFTFAIAGFTSVGPAMLQRRMELASLKRFEIVVVVAFAIFQVSIAYIYPTVWALVWGLLFGAAFRTVGSFLVCDVTHRFTLTKSHALRIFRFAKWIGLASVVYFLTMSFDRLYLAQGVPLQVLGVYSIARTIADIPSLLVLSLGNSLVFPYIASNSTRDRASLRQEIAQTRFLFLIVSMFGLSVLAASADLGIKILFDERYQAAGWMTSVLVLGGWFTLLCTLNESTVLGLGKSIYSAVGHGVKFVWLAGMLPFGLAKYGITGAVVVVALADVCRYFSILAGQMRERFSFFGQDIGTTFMLVLMVGCWFGLRWVLDLGFPL